MSSIKVLRARGQITLPEEIRRAAHLEEGDPVEFELTPEGVLIRPKKIVDATQAWFWTREWQAGEARASDEIEAGRTTVHKNTAGFLAALDEAE